MRSMLWLRLLIVTPGRLLRFYNFDDFVGLFGVGDFFGDFLRRRTSVFWLHLSHLAAQTNKRLKCLKVGKEPAADMCCTGYW